MESRNETSNNKRKRAETEHKYLAKSHYRNKATKEQKKSLLQDQINEMIEAKQEKKKLVFSIEDQYTIFSMMQVLRPQLNKLKKAVYMVDTIILKDIFEGGYNERLSPNIDSFFATLLELAHMIDLSFITKENISWDDQPLLSHFAKFNLYLEKKMLILSKAFFSDDPEKRKRIIKQVLNLSPLLKSVTVIDDKDLTESLNQEIGRLTTKELMSIINNHDQPSSSKAQSHFGMSINFFLAPTEQSCYEGLKQFALEFYRHIIMNISEKSERVDFPKTLQYDSHAYRISPALFRELMTQALENLNKDFNLEITEDAYHIRLIDKPENQFGL